MGNRLVSRLSARMEDSGDVHVFEIWMQIGIISAAYVVTIDGRFYSTAETRREAEDEIEDVISYYRLRRLEEE